MNKITKDSIIANVRKIVYKQEFSSMLILVVMFVITAILQDNFFERGSVIRNINAFAPLILLSMGQAVVIISGALDLSAGAALSLLTCVLTFVMKQDSPVTGAYALVAAFIVAVLMGVINGIGIGYLRIPPVIITFATSYIWLGAALFIRPTPGGESVPWFKIFYDTNSAEGVPGFIKAIGSVLPPALMLVLAGCLIWYVISKTRTGRYIYAVGSNSDSAYATGVNTAKVPDDGLHNQFGVHFPGGAVLCRAEPIRRREDGRPHDLEMHRGCRRRRHRADRRPGKRLSGHRRSFDSELCQ